MVEKGMACVKYLLFAFNLLFFIFGAVLIGVGAYVQVELSNYLDFFDTGTANSTALLIIVVGALTLIIGFFGCCGAIKENNCMVMTFAVLIAIILITEIGGGIAAFVFKAEVQDLLKTGMNHTMQDYYKPDGHDNQQLWNATQTNLECCGITGHSDWDNLGPVPASCCPEANCASDDDYYKKGCLEKIENIVKNNVVIVAGVAIGLGVVEFLGIVFACCLGSAIRKEGQYA